MSFGGHNTVTTPAIAPKPSIWKLPGNPTAVAGTPSAAIGSPGTPTPPDAIRASSNAALAAKAAADRIRKRLSGTGTLLTGTPGASTPKAITAPATLLGRPLGPAPGRY
jgi:hypothetical protein